MENISHYSDKFSWRRMASVGYMYTNSIRIHLALTIGLTVLSYLLTQLGDNSHMKGSLFIMGSTIASLFLYFSPLAFARRDDSLMCQLPVKPIEKWAFYMLYVLILTPLLVETSWYGTNGIFLLFGRGYGWTDMCAMARDIGNPGIDLFMDSINFPFYILATVSQIAVYTLMILYVVIRARSHRAIKAILAFIAVIFAIGFLSGIAGFVVALTESTHTTDPDMIVSEIVNAMQPIIYSLYALCAIFSIVFARLTYLQLAKRQVKN